LHCGIGFDRSRTVSGLTEGDGQRQSGGCFPGTRKLSIVLLNQQLWVTQWETGGFGCLHVWVGMPLDDVSEVQFVSCAWIRRGWSADSIWKGQLVNAKHDHVSSGEHDCVSGSAAIFEDGLSFDWCVGWL
jgi:hypothetical protein